MTVLNPRVSSTPLTVALVRDIISKRVKIDYAQSTAFQRASGSATCDIFSHPRFYMRSPLTIESYDSHITPIPITVGRRPRSPGRQLD